MGKRRRYTCADTRRFSGGGCATAATVAVCGCAAVLQNGVGVSGLHVGAPQPLGAAAERHGLRRGGGGGGGVGGREGGEERSGAREDVRPRALRSVPSNGASERDGARRTGEVMDWVGGARPQQRSINSSSSSSSRSSSSGSNPGDATAAGSSVPAVGRQARRQQQPQQGSALLRTSAPETGPRRSIETKTSPHTPPYRAAARGGARYSHGNNQPKARGGKGEKHWPTSRQPIFQTLTNKQFTCIRRIQKLGRIGLPKAAVKVFKKALKNAPHQFGEPLCMEFYRAGLNALGKAGEVRQALELLREMEAKGDEALMPDASCFNCCLQAAARGKKPQVAMKLMEEMRQRGGKFAPDDVSYTFAVQACSRVGQVKNAMALLETMKMDDIRPSTRIYTYAIQAAAKAGAPNMARTLYGEMRLRGLQPDSFTFSALMESCGKAGLWDRAQSTLTDMRLMGIAPCAACMNGLILAYSNAGLNKEAEKVLDSMLLRHREDRHSEKGGVVVVQQQQQQEEEEEQGGEKQEQRKEEKQQEPLLPVADSYTFGSVLDAHAKAGDAVSALRVLSKMPIEGVPITSHCYTSAICACGKAGRWKDALRLLEHDMYYQKAAPEARWKHTGWVQKRQAMWLFEVAGVPGKKQNTRDRKERRPEEKHQQKRWGRGGGLDASPFHAAMSACAQAGQWEEAERLLPRMRAHGLTPGKLAYNSVLHAMARASQSKPALALLWDMEDTFGVTPDVVSFSTVMDACGRAGNPRGALRLLYSMEMRGIKPDEVAFGVAVAACARTGMFRQAEKIIESMKAEYGITPSEAVYTAAMHACARRGNWRRAVLLLERMQTDHGGQRSETSTRAFAAAIHACGVAGNPSAARDVLNLMAEAGVEPDVYCLNAAIHACAVAGEPTRCLQILSSMREPTVVSYNTALDGLARAGQAHVATELLDKLERTAGLVATEITFLTVLKACSRYRFSRSIGSWRYHGTGSEADLESRQQQGHESQRWDGDHHNGPVWEIVETTLDEMRKRGHPVGTVALGYAVQAAQQACGDGGGEPAAKALGRLKLLQREVEERELQAKLATDRKETEWNIKQLQLKEEKNKRKMLLLARERREAGEGPLR